MHLDVEERLTSLPARLEELSHEMAKAAEDEANSLADYEEAFYRCVATSQLQAVAAREQEAKAETVKFRRPYLLAVARVKALRSEQAAIEASLSSLQTLARGMYRQGG